MEFNIPSFKLGSKKQQLLADDTIDITPNGKDAIEKGTVYGGIRGRVLNKLYDRGNITIKEISVETGLPVEVVKDAIEYLINKNCATKNG